MSEWINRGKPYWPINIAKAERRFNATYIGDFCVETPIGWSDTPVATFYVEAPAKPEHSNYFGLYVAEKKLMICDARSVAEGHWNGMMADDGEIIYSRFHHDHRESRDGTAWVDGGRDYFKGRGNKPVRLSIVRDQIMVNDVLLFPVRDGDD